MKSELILGGHVSAVGGISQSLSRVSVIGGNAVQFFSASPRVWKRMTISPAEIERFNRLKDSLGIVKSVIHAVYLLNLASENEELARKSREVIEFDMQVDSATDGSGVVVHLGSHLGKGFDAIKHQLVGAIKQVLSHTPTNSRFLIENSAGQQGKIASDLSEIRWLLTQINSPRLGWCLDTCHAFAAGYSLSQDNTKTPVSNFQYSLIDETHASIFTEIDEFSLWDTLSVIHVNDSRDPFSSGRDRHANIGEGQIGSEMLRSFLSHEKVKDLPLILEVPGIDGKSGPDRENLDRIKALCR